MTKFVTATAVALALATPAFADTLTVSYYYPADGQGLQTIAQQTGPLPDILMQNVLLGTATLPSSQWFGLGAIDALLIPTGPGNQVPTFEFAFNDGFVPQTGGTLFLFATWSSINLTNNKLTMPTSFATDEMPGGPNGLYVVGQVFTGPNGQTLPCDNFVRACGTGAFSGQFTDTVSSQNVTLTTIAPGASFSITEEFVFGNNAFWNGVVQGDVGAYILTTPLAQTNPVPGPVAGAGLPGLLAAAAAWWYRRRRKRS